MNSCLRVKNNAIFSYKFILQYGIHLGGNLQLLQIETSSIVFGIRASNIIINLNNTSVELSNILDIIKGLGFYRTMIYFINSTVSFRLSFKATYLKFNKHMFFPINAKIQNVFRKLNFLLIDKHY